MQPDPPGPSIWVDLLCDGSSRVLRLSSMTVSPSPAIRPGESRRGEGDDCFAFGTGKGIELRTVFARFSPKHRDPTERAMLDFWLRLRGHCANLRQANAYLLIARVRRSAQYSVTAKMPKATAMAATTIASVGIGYLPRFAGKHSAANAGRTFDPDQFAFAHAFTVIAGCRRSGAGRRIGTACSHATKGRNAECPCTKASFSAQASRPHTCPARLKMR
jgi:hypothetical protein